MPKLVDPLKFHVLMDSLITKMLAYHSLPGTRLCR
jgi:hypothetical protein